MDELAPTQVVLEAAGVGYALGISLNTYTAIQGKQQVRLFVYEYIREDAWQLYGFATRAERELFLLLINVQGVGCQTARMILSAFTPADLAGIVQAEDVRTLKSVKGIGPKAAGRIVMDLKDKMMSFMGESSKGDGGSVGMTVVPAMVEEAVQALTVLGFSPAPAQKVVMQIAKEQPGLHVEQLIKLALKML